MPEEAVTDSSPLIVLARAGHLDLLLRTYRKVHVPPEVLSEIEAGPEDDAARREMWGSSRLIRLPPLPIDPRVVPWNLGPGEAAVVTHALRLRGSETLLDDRVGRIAARALGLSTRGTLGLLLLAKRRGVLSKVHPVLDDVVRAGLYVTPTLRSACLRAAGEPAS